MERARYWSSLLGTTMILVSLALGVSALLSVELYRDWALVPGADVFDPTTHTWSVRSEVEPETGSSPVPGAPSLGASWMVADLPGRTAVAVTRPQGRGSSGERSSMQWYDGHHWSSMGTLERAWVALWATRLVDGTVVMADTGSTLIFDPLGRTMRSVAAPPLGQVSNAVLVAAGDHVYATTTNSNDVVAMLRPGDGTWTPLPPAPTYRSSALPRGLPDGGLMLAHGFEPAHELRGDVLVTFIMILGVATVGLLGSIWWVGRAPHSGGLIAGVVLGSVLGFFVWVVFTAAVSVEGRPLRLGRRTWRGRVRLGDERAVGSSLSWPTRRLLARAWANDAALEHASIAAFEQLAQQLEAVGAPSELVARARCAALEEAEHTGLCRAQAERHAGRELVLAPLPALPVPSACQGREREALLVRLAVESFVDGTLGEGFAAASAAAALTEATDPEVRRTLEIIARDEASHAAHARDVVAWCEAEGGEPVHEAIRRVTARERRRVRHRGLPVLRWTDALAQHGRFREARPGALDAALRSRS